MGDQIESSILLTLSFFLPQLSFVFNPLNAKGVYIRPLMVISVTKYVFHGQPRAFIYVRWLFVLWILGRCICYIGTYIYALGCWCQNSVAFKWCATFHFSMGKELWTYISFSSTCFCYYRKHPNSDNMICPLGYFACS